MNVVIRTDASRQIGTGHVMRCLTLAEHLRTRGAKVTFICREHRGHLCGHLESKAFRVIRLAAPDSTPVVSDPDNYQAWLSVPREQDVRETRDSMAQIPEECDWLVADHYGLDIAWEREFRGRVKRIMVIDDLADRQHDCDLLLDQNFYLDLDTRYDTLIPVDCRRLLGPRFAILRPQFYDSRRNLRKRDGRIKRILVFYGGVDATGETLKALGALKRHHSGGLEVEVIADGANRDVDAIMTICGETAGFHWQDRVDNMAGMMADADMSFGGGGTATWERCFLALPTVTTEIAVNQRVMLEAMASRRAVWHLGRFNQVTEDSLIARLDYALSHPQKVKELGQNALAIMGASHVSECPVASAMIEQC